MEATNPWDYYTTKCIFLESYDEIMSSIQISCHQILVQYMTVIQEFVVILPFPLGPG